MLPLESNKKNIIPIPLDAELQLVVCSPAPAVPFLFAIRGGAVAQIRMDSLRRGTGGASKIRQGPLDRVVGFCN